MKKRITILLLVAVLVSMTACRSTRDSHKTSTDESMSSFASEAKEKSGRADGFESTVFITKNQTATSSTVTNRQAEPTSRQNNSTKEVGRTSALPKVSAKTGQDVSERNQTTTRIPMTTKTVKTTKTGKTSGEVVTKKTTKTSRTSVKKTTSNGAIELDEIRDW